MLSCFSYLCSFAIIEQLICSLHFSQFNIIIIGHLMLAHSLSRSAYRRSILSGIRAYKNSKTQQKMHEFSPCPKKLAAIKSTLDYETINKQSQAHITIRQFLFQEEKPSYQINFRKKYLVPVGKWTFEDLSKVVEESNIQAQTTSEKENEMILKNCEEEMKVKLEQYYSNMGKSHYTFSVKEEIMKIEKMTASEFERFMAKLNQF